MAARTHFIGLPQRANPVHPAERGRLIVLNRQSGAGKQRIKPSIHVGKQRLRDDVQQAAERETRFRFVAIAIGSSRSTRTSSAMQSGSRTPDEFGHYVVAVLTKSLHHTGAIGGIPVLA